MKKLLPFIFLLLAFVVGKLIFTPLSSLLDEKKLQSDAIIYRNTSDFDSLRMGDIVLSNPLTDYEIDAKYTFGSELTRMGIVVLQGHELFVAGMHDNLKLMPIYDWIDVGAESKFKVLRLKHSSIDSFKKLPEFVDSLGNIKIDYNYSPDSKTLYPAEFIFNIYMQICNIELCKAKSVDSISSNNENINKLKQFRAQAGISPSEKVILPSEIETSDYLKLILIK